MNIKKILCPIDFSEFNQTANEFASTLADSWQADLVYLTVPAQGGFGNDYEYAMQRIAERELARLKKFQPTRPGVSCSYDVKVSSLTAQTIVEYAAENSVDLIVMMTHGRTGLRRIVMGSVAEYVVRNATCPVLVLKPDDREWRDTNPNLVAPAMTGKCDEK